MIGYRAQIARREIAVQRRVVIAGVPSEIPAEAIKAAIRVCRRFDIPRHSELLAAFARLFQGST